MSTEHLFPVSKERRHKVIRPLTFCLDSCIERRGSEDGPHGFSNCRTVVLFGRTDPGPVLPTISSPIPTREKRRAYEPLFVSPPCHRSTPVTTPSRTGHRDPTYSRHPTRDRTEPEVTPRLTHPSRPLRPNSKDDKG